jgi:hypothetical protein
MQLVNTADIEGAVTPIKYARTPDGKIDYKAYCGLTGSIKANGLTVNVRIVDARRRYGHLDLQVTPMDGADTVWVERKNIIINDDPANSVTPLVKSTKKVFINGMVVTGDISDAVLEQLALSGAVVQIH